jgi:hypothetical protein
MEGGGKLFHCTICTLVTCFDCTEEPVLSSVGGRHSAQRHADFVRRQAPAMHMFAFAPCADCAADDLPSSPEPLSCGGDAPDSVRRPPAQMGAPPLLSTYAAAG